MDDKIKFVSLGYNCEVSFRIQDYEKKPLDSYPFSWAFIHNTEKFIRVLNNLSDLLTHVIEYDEKSNMVEDKEYEISFHLKGAKDYFYSAENGAVIEEHLSEGIEELRSRIGHCIDKWKKLFAEDNKVIFVVKSKGYDAQLLDKLYSFLENNFKCGKFLLLVVYERNNQVAFLENKSYEKMICFTIEQFAAVNNTKEGGDIRGWMDALEFAEKTMKLRLFKRKETMEKDEDNIFQKRLETLQKGMILAKKYCSTDVTNFYVIVNRHLGDIARMMREINQVKLYYGAEADRYHFGSGNLQSPLAKEYNCASTFPKRKYIKKLYIIANEALAGVAKLYSKYIDGIIVLDQDDLDAIELYAYSGCGIHQNILCDSAAAVRLCARWKFDEGDWVRGMMFKLNAFKWQLALPKDLPSCQPEVSDNTLKETQKLIEEKKITPESSVILCPVSRGSSMLDDSFWEHMVRELRDKGFQCYTNASKKEKAIAGSELLALDVDIIVCLAKLGCHVIGVQCGLMDIFIWTKCPHITVLNIIKSEVDKQYAHNRKVFEEVTAKPDATYLRIEQQDKEHITRLIIDNMR